jgi:predicted nucleotidyltransferase
MTRAELETKIEGIRPRLAEFGVTSLRLFGSLNREEAREGSDIDLLVEFDGPSTFDRYFGLLVMLEDELGAKVDLVEPEKLHPKIRDKVLGEARRVA